MQTVWPIAVSSIVLSVLGAGSAQAWQMGTPIVTYWAGPPMTDATARQMAEGGFNLVWCTEKELDTAQKYGLRALLYDGLISPETLDDPARAAALDALMERVKTHPAMYAYFITDEPSAGRFPALGKLVAYLRDRDPDHLAYINLFPTYANNEQLGTVGDTVTAYREHLRQYVEIVKPDLISYDHYHFAAGGKDGDQYFLNLEMIRRAALEAGVPFLNIVQACTWTPGMRVPTPDEVRWLVYTSLAYGAQGISYYVYCHPGHAGAIARPDGTPTPIYRVLTKVNREFVAIASQVQGLRSLGAYHLGMVPRGAKGLGPGSVFTLDPPVPAMAYNPPEPVEGMLLGLFGQPRKPTHCLVVNLDYKAKVTTTVCAPRRLEVFNALRGTWAPAPAGRRAQLRLAPGGGRLVRLADR